MLHVVYNNKIGVIATECSCKAIDFDLFLMVFFGSAAISDDWPLSGIGISLTAFRRLI
jgi:hypothetical protein